MPIKFDNPKPIDQDTVGAVKGKLGINLPDDYVSLLTTVSNGGAVEPVVFADDLDISVVGFLGIGTDHYDLATRIAQYDGDLPEGLVPIADSEGGNLVCTKVSGDDIGSIWFWDHELEVDAARKVTGSLDDFIEGLHPYDDADPQPKVLSVWVKPGFLEQLKREGKL